jgi:cytochrome c oxidase subunit I
MSYQRYANRPVFVTYWYWYMQWLVIGFLGFIVWAQSYVYYWSWLLILVLIFTAATMNYSLFQLVLKFLVGLATLWAGTIDLKTPLFWAFRVYKFFSQLEVCTGCCISKWLVFDIAFHVYLFMLLAHFSLCIIYGC